MYTQARVVALAPILIAQHIVRLGQLLEHLRLLLLSPTSTEESRRERSVGIWPVSCANRKCEGDEQIRRVKQTYPMPAGDVRMQLEGEALVRRLDVRQARTPAHIFTSTRKMRYVVVST